MTGSNLRYAFRVLARDRGFTLTVVLTLALGIGAATTIFSVVNTVLLEPLGYREPDRLVLIRERIPKVTPELLAVPAPDVLEFQHATNAFDAVAGWQSDARDLGSDQSQPVRIDVSRVTANLFGLLGRRPALGRTFTPDEDRLGQPLAVLSDAVWRTRFASDPNILGRTILLHRVPYTVIGVMGPDCVFPPPGLRRSVPSGVWIPMAFTADERASFGDNFDFNAVARLRSGVTLEKANAVLSTVAARIREHFPEQLRSEFNLEAIALPLRDQMVGQVRTLVLLLAAAVFLLLLIAAGNVANLMLSRAAAREREFAIRAAIEAGRWRIVQQWLAESLLLASAGGLLGLLLACYGTDALAHLTTLNVPRLAEAHVDARVLAVSLALSVLNALLFGTVPALFAPRTRLTEGLKAGGRSAAGQDRHRLRSALVVSEVALALILLVGAGLLLRSFLALRATDPGFRGENVLFMSLSLPGTAYPSSQQVAKFTEELDRRLSAVPGVVAVGAGNGLPLIGTGWRRLFTTDNEAALQGRRPPAVFSIVYRDYLQALGIPLKRGRLFNDADRGSRRVIVSEGTARQLWPGQDPIGRAIKWGIPQDDLPWFTVIGVVGDVKDGPLDQPSPLHAYGMAGQQTGRDAPQWFNNEVWVVRSAGAPETLASAMRAAVASLDPQMPVERLETMAQVLDGSLSSRRLETWVIGLFAGAALMLAAIGTYGLIAYSVTERTREIGIRVALGATAAGVIRMVLRGALALTVTGIVAGAALSFVLTRYISSLLFGVKPADPVTFVAVAVVVLAVGAAASFVPARRAMKVDPMVALRRE